MDHLERSSNQRHAPRLRIFTRSDRRVGREHDPTLGHSRFLVERRVHRVGAMIIRGRDDDENRPRPRGIEVLWKTDQRPAGRWPGIAAGRGVILKIFIERIFDIERSTRSHDLTGECCASAIAGTEPTKNDHRDDESRSEAVHDLNQSNFQRIVQLRAAARAKLLTRAALLAFAKFSARRQAVSYGKMAAA